MTEAKRNYEINDAKLLAIVESFCHCCHYLEQLYHTVEIRTDYSNLRAFMSIMTSRVGKRDGLSTCLHLIFGWFIEMAPSTLRTVLHVN